MEKLNYFNDLSEAYAKKNKTDLVSARLEVSKLIRINLTENSWEDKDVAYFNKSLFYTKDLEKVLTLRQLEKKKKFKKSSSDLELAKFKDSLKSVKILVDFTASKKLLSIISDSCNINRLLNTSKEVSNNLLIGKDTYIHVVANTYRQGKFIYTDSYALKGTISPKFLTKRKELVFTDIAGVATAISKYVDSEGFAECLYINNKNVNIFHGYIHIPSSTHGKSIDEIKNLLKKREDLKNTSKAKREFSKKLKELSSELLVTRNDSLNAGNCVAGTDNFISRYLENKETVKLSKLYELAKNKDLDIEIKSRLKNVISLKERQLDNTLSNLNNLIKI